LEYVREEMKNQYKKLNETTKLWERKYELLKRKIFEEYRSKIVDLLNKKEKSSVGQLEVVL
jgi:DNA-binding transcriptional regulator GbsR (MarR family)